MVAGTISKIVNSYGSRWGHVRPNREPREVFFNFDSLADGVDFTALALGDQVEFEQEADRANGMRAFNLTVTARAPQEVVVAVAAPAIAAEVTGAVE